MNRLSIIDIDSMFYQTSNCNILEECIIKFNERLNNCLEKTECDYWAGFTSKGKTFRHKLFDGYKSNRTQAPPKYLQSLKEWAITEYNLNVSVGYEADDAVAYWMKQPLALGNIAVNTNEINISYADLVKSQVDNLLPNYIKIYEPVEKIMCAIDKDLLLSIPGKHFNYTYKLEVKDNPNSVIKGWWVETDEVDSKSYTWKQMIMGDNSDGIGGIPKLGEVAANKMIVDCDEIKLPYYEAVIRKYINYYGQSQGIFNFQQNYRLLHMLDCDEDFIREVGKLPEFPQIQKIIKPIVDEKIEF